MHAWPLWSGQGVPFRAVTGPVILSTALHRPPVSCQTQQRTLHFILSALQAANTVGTGSCQILHRKDVPLSVLWLALICHHARHACCLQPGLTELVLWFLLATL